MRASYSGNDLLDALLMTLHLQEGLDLADGEILPIPQGDQLIECAEELEGILENLTFLQILAGAGDDLGEEM